MTKAVMTAMNLEKKKDSSNLLVTFLTRRINSVFGDDDDEGKSFVSAIALAVNS